MSRLQKWLVGALWVSLLFSPNSARADDDTSQTTQDAFVPNEVVLKLQSTSDLAGITAGFNLGVLDQFGARPIYRLQINDSVPPPDKANALLADSRVVYAEPNFEFQAPESRARSRPPWVIGGGSGGGDSMWASNALRLEEAHAISRGAGMRVAVLDTGVDTTHPLLAGKLMSGYDFVDDDTDPSERGTTNDYGYGHGTHVAGLVTLVAPDAKIMPIRALDPAGLGNIWVLAEALAYAFDPDGNPQTNDGAHVINLSLGTTRETELLENIIDEITCNDDDSDDDDRCNDAGGAVVVAAAGNLGNETPHYPAAEQNVTGLIAVAASTQSNTLASFSTRGSWVKVAAPGENILSSVPGGGTGVWSGTSMAAPLTAGVAALARAQTPTYKPADITNLIVSKGFALCSGSIKHVDAAATLGLPQRSQSLCQTHIPLVIAS
jgi:subtilisin family serine protease